jgi:hypothetical protein
MLPLDAHDIAVDGTDFIGALHVFVLIADFKGDRAHGRTFPSKQETQPLSTAAFDLLDRLTLPWADWIIKPAEFGQSD